MKRKLFGELMESVREGGAILRGENSAHRMFIVEEPDVRSLRERQANAPRPLAQR